MQETSILVPIIQTTPTKAYVFCASKILFNNLLKATGVHYCSRTKAVVVESKNAEEMREKVKKLEAWILRSRHSPLLAPATKLFGKNCLERKYLEKLPKWFEDDQIENSFRFMGNQEHLVKASLHGESVNWFAECGTGKTLMSIKLAEYYLDSSEFADWKDSRPIVVITEFQPLQLTWGQHIKRFSKNLSQSFLIIDKSLTKKYKATKKKPARIEKKDLRDTKIICVNYDRILELIGRLKEQNILIGTLIIDESHNALNISSKRNHLGAIQLSKMARRTISMTGTPNPNSVNDPMRYITHLRLLHPDTMSVSEFFSFRDFMMVQVATTKTRGVIWKPQKKFFQMANLMLSPFTYRLFKESVCEIPTKKIRYVEYHPDPILVETNKKFEDFHRVNIKGIVVDCLKELDIMRERANRRGGFSETDEEILTTVLRQKTRQLCSGFALHHKEKNVVARPMGEILIAKEAKLLQLLTELFGRGDVKQVIIWAEYKASHARIRDIIKRMCGDISCEVVNSATSGNKKKKYVESFIAGDLQVIISHMSSLGTGVTLFGDKQVPCKTAIFYEQTEDGKNFAQAIDRIHRPGQKQEVTNYIFRGVESLEEYICENTYKKYMETMGKDKQV